MKDINWVEQRKMTRKRKTNLSWLDCSPEELDQRVTDYLNGRDAVYRYLRKNKAHYVDPILRKEMENKKD